MKSLLLRLIRGYQSLSRAGISSPILFGSYSGCRSWPTCSDFALSAIEKDGVLRGGVRAVVRFARCNPLSAVHPQKT